MNKINEIIIKLTEILKIDQNLNSLFDEHLELTETSTLANKIKSDSIEEAKAIQKKISELKIRIKNEEIRINEDQLKIEKRTKSIAAMVGSKLAKSEEKINEIEKRSLEQLKNKHQMVVNELQHFQEKLIKITSSSQEAPDNNLHFDESISDIEKNILELNQEKNNLIEDLPVDLKDQYKKLSLKMKFNSIAKMEINKCSGCNFKLYPQLVNDINSKNEIYFCPNCSRILLPA